MSEGKIIGSVTWFDNKKGYGFVKVLTPDQEKTGQDIFLHFSNIQVEEDEYKVVYPWEYIEFDFSQKENDQGPSCVNVTGIYGGDLLTQNPNHRYKILRKRVREDENEDYNVGESVEAGEPDVNQD